MSIEDGFREGLRVARAGERLLALRYPIGTAVEMCASAEELAPELKPELDAIAARLTETIEHVQAAYLVLSTKLDLVGS